MDPLSFERSRFSARIQGYQQLAGKTPASETRSRAERKDFEAKLDTVTSQMMDLVHSKEARFLSDEDNNPIVNVPNVGSLKLTAQGCEMAVVERHVPFFSRLANSLGSPTAHWCESTTSVNFDQNSGQLQVTNLNGDIRCNTESPSQSTAQGVQESFTLDLNHGKVVDHKSEELGYQFAEQTSYVSNRERKLANPERFLFERTWMNR